MIWNIIDERKRKYRWLEINAVIEDAYHDNTCEDSDQVPDTVDGTLCDQRKNILLHDAVIWAENAPGMVTLYLYDKGAGI